MFTAAALQVVPKEYTLSSKVAFVNASSDMFEALQRARDISDQERFESAMRSDTPLSDICEIGQKFKTTGSVNAIGIMQRVLRERSDFSKDDIAKVLCEPTFARALRSLGDGNVPESLSRGLPEGYTRVYGAPASPGLR